MEANPATTRFPLLSGLVQKAIVSRSGLGFYGINLAPDHLGSSTFLTDANGDAYQIFINLPFGETMAEQLPSDYFHSPYKFNGKELDNETGLCYDEARYYDPRSSIWLSVDPLAEQTMKPYQYVHNDPVNLIDPTGMSAEAIDGGEDHWEIRDGRAHLRDT